MIRRFTVFLVFATVLALTPCARAQENARTEQRSEPAIGWQIANFAILAGFLGYLIYKNAGKFFQARTEQIQRELVESAKAKQEGEARVAEIETRIAKLGAEIERMRTAMRQEMAAEGERIRLDTERHIRRVQEQAEQEIENMIKAARRELKTYSAELAFRLAEEQLKGRITSDVENNLVSSFIADLRTRTGGNSNN
jgi:F0F1-type ATP synthase membrane subunit b/b'